MSKIRGGMGELVRQASRMQRQIDERKAELASEQVKASSGNNAVTAIADGAGRLVSVQIDKKALENEEIELIQDLIVSASNAALSKAAQLVETEIEKITKGMKIPGLF